MGDDSDVVKNGYLYTTRLLKRKRSTGSFMNSMGKRCVVHSLVDYVGPELSPHPVRHAWARFFYVASIMQYVEIDCGWRKSSLSKVATLNEHHLQTGGGSPPFIFLIR